MERSHRNRSQTTVMTTVRVRLEIHAALALQQKLAQLGHRLAVPPQLFKHPLQPGLTVTVGMGEKTAPGLRKPHTGGGIIEQEILPWGRQALRQ